MWSIVQFKPSTFPSSSSPSEPFDPESLLGKWRPGTLLRQPKPLSLQELLTLKHSSAHKHTNTHARAQTALKPKHIVPHSRSVSLSIGEDKDKLTSLLLSSATHTNTGSRTQRHHTRRHARPCTLGCTLHNTHRHTPFWSDPLPTWLKKDKRGCELQQNLFSGGNGVCVCVCGSTHEH